MKKDYLYIHSKIGRRDQAQGVLDKNMYNESHTSVLVSLMEMKKSWSFSRKLLNNTDEPIGKIKIVKDFLRHPQDLILNTKVPRCQGYIQV